MPSRLDLHADLHPPLPAERLALFSRFGQADGDAPPYFPGFVGLRLEEVRVDYARMRLPHRRELDQAHGIVHGGATATLVDTVVVPAIASVYEQPRPLLTIGMSLQFLAAIRGEDAIAEGWVEKRGRSTCFCRVVVRTAAGDLAATASVVYKVGVPIDTPRP